MANKVAENALLSTYVQISDLIDSKTGEKHPMIEMGVYKHDEFTNEGSFGEFKLRITETGLQFMQWDEPIAWLSNKELHINKAVIEEELSVGGFVLKQHGIRNNVGFLWRGVTSIKFTIDGDRYEVKNGTTWYEWAKSNGWNCSGDEDVIRDSDNTYHVVDEVMEDVHGSDVIVEGNYYTIM